VNEDPDQVIQEVGHRVAALRKKLGMTQAELAEKLGSSYQNVARIERGEQNLTIRTMVKLAAALGVRMLDLVEVPEATKGRRPVR
jgi:transcriptional regulator with XRE-family HTH domain